MTFTKVQTFVTEARRVDSNAALVDSLCNVSDDVGFDSFALLYAPRVEASPSELVQLTTYPEEWIRRIRERAYWMDDPVFVACERANAGFEWRDLPDMIRLNPRQQRMMVLAENCGLRNGFTVPIPKCGNIVSLCSFATGREKPLDPGNAAAAQAVAWFAYEAVCRLNENRAEIVEEAVSLTPRQLDCIVLFARGKSDRVIAQLLGISPRTANEHIEKAKKRFGVSTRQQLLSRALWFGQISYADIL